LSQAGDRITEINAEINDIVLGTAHYAYTEAGKGRWEPFIKMQADLCRLRGERAGLMQKLDKERKARDKANRS
jgi:hypothetical protein